MRLRRFLANCRLRHRFSRWAVVKVEQDVDWSIDIRGREQFRMCRNCGHQEIRELTCV